MEKHFAKFKQNIVGDDLLITTPYGEKTMIYADWLASGRFYKPIEDKLLNEFGPYIGNTHTETNTTGTLMTNAYHYAQHIIKKHVNADKDDVILFAGFGMTAVVNKLQRILGLKTNSKYITKKNIPEQETPVVFITHMEHHSNHTSWLETICDVVVVNFDENLLVDIKDLELQLEKYKDRKIKIGSFSAASNVTGIKTPVHQMAKTMHQHGGICFIDYAGAAPYIDINMHPEDPMEKLDGVLFSPHKFLGGPGTSGVMIFDSKIYDRTKSPDHPGGGTVKWTNAWGEYSFVDNIEAREDGGTPGFLLAMKTALAVKVKEQMGVENIEKREEELLSIAFDRLEKIDKLHILAGHCKNRIGVISFYIDDLHYNFVVKLLNDLYGIQTRGGCACAGTYGHLLLGVSHEDSNKISSLINQGDLSKKPGWVRLSIHPTMTNKELYIILDAIEYIIKNYSKYEKDYTYDKHTNEFTHVSESADKTTLIKHWFDI